MRRAWSGLWRLLSSEGPGLGPGRVELWRVGRGESVPWAQLTKLVLPTCGERSGTFSLVDVKTSIAFPLFCPKHPALPVWGVFFPFLVMWDLDSFLTDTPWLVLTSYLSIESLLISNSYCVSGIQLILHCLITFPARRKDVIHTYLLKLVLLHSE